MSDNPFEKARKEQDLWTGTEPYPDLQDDYRFAQPLDYIPVTKAPARNRKWEKKNKPRAFRRVPPNVQDAVRAVAKKETLPVDDIANALLDYSLNCYEQNQLHLEAELSQYRRTLMPERGWDGRPRVRWLEERWIPNPPRQTKLRERQTNSAQPWKDWPIVAYRLRPEVAQQIDEIWKRMQVPAGELVSRLLMHALNLYFQEKLFFMVEGETGRLVEPAAAQNPAPEPKLKESDWRPK